MRLIYGITSVLTLAGAETLVVIAQVGGGEVANPALFWANTGLLASIVAVLGAIVRAILRGDLVVIKSAEREAQLAAIVADSKAREEQLQQLARRGQEREDRLWKQTKE